MMSMHQGTRDAPIIIDDEDENDIILIAGPSRLPQKPSNGQMHSTTNNSTALPKTSAASNSKSQSLSVGSCAPASSIGRCFKREADVPLRPRRNHPQSETVSSSSSILHVMPVPNTLKRKRSLEDAQSQVYRQPPLPPSWVAPVSDPSADALSHLSKSQRKKLRRRLRAEEEARVGTVAPKLTPLAPPPAPPVQSPRPDLPTGLTLPSRTGGPERATYNGPNWPMHIAKGSEAPIPGPGHGPLSYGGSSQGSSNALSNTLNSQAPLVPSGVLIGMSPNAFGPPTRIIGKWTSPGSGFGLFPVSRDQYIAHDPACTLVLENMPKRFRTLDFVLRWCRDTALANDPAPLHVDVMRKLGKALVEFTTEERAFRAFSSPKLINGDGRAQISAYWFCPENSVPASLPARPPQCVEHVASVVSSRPALRFTLASPLQLSRVASATPYSQPVDHPTATAPSLQSPPPSDVRAFEPQPRLQSVQTSQQEDREDVQRQDDTEMEEGEIKESREPDDEIRDHFDGPSSATRFSQRADIAHVEPRGRTRQWSPQNVGYVTAPIHNCHVNVQVHAREQTSPLTPERESNGGLQTSSVHMPPWPSHLTESVKDASHREESPQLMYPSLEESGPDSSSAGDFLAVRESGTSVAAPVRSDGSIDVTMDIEIPTIPTPPTCDAYLLPPPVVLTSSTDTKSVTMSEHRHQPSGLNRHDLMSTLVSEQDETAKETASSADTQLEALPQSLSEKLLELRQRVLAGKKRKLATMELPVSSSDKLTPVTTHDSAESDDATFSSAQSTTSTSSTSSSSSAVSFFSTKSISTSTSSVSSSADSILPKSASYFDNMATAFLEDILGTCKSGPPPSSDIKSAGLSTDKVHIGSKTLLQNKQNRFEKYLVKSKALFAQREAAEEKSEKTRIWALIKEEQRAFEAEEAAADAKLKHIEAAEATSTRSKLARKKPPFIRWPQTRLDQMIVSVSDSEDDECASEGDE